MDTGRWNDGRNKEILLNLFHVLVVTPFFIYIGIQRTSIPEVLYSGLIGLSIAIFFYHFYRGYSNWKAGKSSLWVNLFHMAIIVPLLLWIGYHGKNTSRAAFEMMLLLGFSALGYHLYRLVLVTNTVSD